jgi:Arc/MetJ family transcription regulator
MKPPTRHMKPAAKKKTYRLDSQAVATARRALNTATDTEAIHKALQKVVADVELEHALDKMLRRGQFRTIYR